MYGVVSGRAFRNNSLHLLLRISQANAMQAETTYQILLVDDDLRLRALLESFLKRDGFDVLVAGNARQMEKRLAEHHVDLMVLDLMLPDRSGLDICRDLRGAGNRLPV